MLVHGLSVESVDLRRLGGSAGGNDVLGDNFDGCPETPGEKKLGPLRRKGACDSAADRASGSVDHRNLVFQHHLDSLRWWELRLSIESGLRDLTHRWALDLPRPEATEDCWARRLIVAL
jgi:hypothetical protein